MSNKKIYTHSGKVSGNSSSGCAYCIRMALRKTKLYWVSVGGIKFHVVTGIQAGTYASRVLELATIQSLPEPIPHPF